MFVIHNISIATDDDIIQFDDDINIYPVYLSRTIIVCGNCLNWLEKIIVSGYIFCQFLETDLGTHLWPLSVGCCITFSDFYSLPGEIVFNIQPDVEHWIVW